MTNGEKIKEIFPNAEYLECEVVMDVVFARNQENWFDLEWWNAEYKEPMTKNDLGVASELEKNSKKLEKGTTKNDLGVDCISRQAIRGYIDYILSHGMGKKKSFGFIKKFVDKLPSVTPQEPILDKVRAEIIELRSRQNVGVLECLDIIDKYKAETEE